MLSTVKLRTIRDYTAHTDQELLQLIKGDDMKAYETLYRRYYVYLCNKAYKRVPMPAVVEELVQDVFVNCWNKRENLEADGNVAAWLFATLRNKVLHELRSSYHQKARQMEWPVAGVTDTGADDELDAKSLEARILGVVNGLPPQCREAFRLSRFEQLSYKEIAVRMNISVKTVEKHVSKALQLLKTELHEYNLALVLLFWVLSW